MKFSSLSMLILGQQYPGLTNQVGGTGKHYDPINGQGCICNRMERILSMQDVVMHQSGS